MSEMLAGRPTEAEMEFERMRRWAKEKAHQAHNGETDEAIHLRRLRDSFTKRFGFAVITQEAIDAVADQLPGRRFVEIGAGNGYLAWELQRRGWDVIATDPYPPPNNAYTLAEATETAVLPLDGRVAIRQWPDRDIIWSWPVMDGEAAEIIRHYQGDNIIYIGERPDGCTGGPDFHEDMRSRYRNTALIKIPNFPVLHDRVEVLRKVRENQGLLS